MNQNAYSVAIIQESVAAFRNFSRKPTYLSSLNVELLKIMITLAREPKFEKQRVITMQAIKNLSKLPEIERYFKTMGANDVLLMANMQANVGN